MKNRDSDISVLQKNICAVQIKTFDSHVLATRRTMSLLLSRYRPLNHLSSLLEANTISIPFKVCFGSKYIILPSIR